MSLENLIRNRQFNDLTGEQANSKRSHLKDKSITAGKVELMRVVRNRLTEETKNLELDTAEFIELIREKAWRSIEELAETEFSYLVLTSGEKSGLLDQLIQNMFGLGIIEPLVNDESITEIMINGPEHIFIEKNGLMTRVLDKMGHPLRFNSRAELMHVIDKIVAPINRKVDESDPIVDARLPNGSRVNVVINPVSLDGAAVTIRKFPANPYSMEQLTESGMLTTEVAQFLATLVRAGYNIIVSGGTGSGKTTFLNALSMFITPSERLVTVEDSAELKLSLAENIVRLETRPPNIEGKGNISIRDLVRTALRMRPDRIIVGEVRGGEALDMLQAMNTGHDGSLTTGHANSAWDMLCRIETMVLMAGMELPIAAIRQQIGSAVDFVIHLSKLRDGSRRVLEVTEIVGLEGTQIITNELYKYHIDGFADGKVVGRLFHTGNVLHRVDKLLSSGLRIKDDLLDQETRGRLYAMGAGGNHNEL